MRSACTSSFTCAQMKASFPVEGCHMFREAHKSYTEPLKNYKMDTLMWLHQANMLAEAPLLVLLCPLRSQRGIWWWSLWVWLPLLGLMLVRLSRAASKATVQHLSTVCQIQSPHFDPCGCNGSLEVFLWVIVNHPLVSTLRLVFGGTGFSHFCRM